MRHCTSFLINQKMPPNPLAAFSHKEDFMYRLWAIATLLLSGVPVWAADWPQWLGPQRNGASSETVAPWKESPRVLWSQPVGEGNSSPVVADGRVLLHTKVTEMFAEQLTAYDAATGKVLWQTVYKRSPFKSPYGNGPRATPAVVGGKVYTHGITGVITCLDAANGHQLWQVDTWQTFKTPNLLFGASCSPLVDGNRVLLNVGGKGAGVVAFDRDKGDVLWQSLDDRASYSSPIVFGKGTERQVVFLTQQGLVALKPDDGSVCWRYAFKDLLFESSTTPMRAGDVLVASSITIGSTGLQLENRNQAPAAAQLWKNPALTSYFATPVPVGKDHFYMVTGTNPADVLNPFGKKKKPQADLHCVETRTGKELWKRPQVGQYHASLLRTGDNKLLLLEEAGNLVLLDPDPKEYRELARAKVCGNTWAHAALANGRLYVRDNTKLRCLELGQ
jgi:outer membrane protein assembly factor BamB